MSLRRDGGAVSDLGVQWRALLGISAFVAVIAAVYWFASHEEAGTTLLALASGLTLLSGGYLLLQERRGAAESDQREDGDGVPYLPHASVWPLVVGAGAVAACNGMILGMAYCTPGVVVTAVGLAGMASQSRRRA